MKLLAVLTVILLLPGCIVYKITDAQDNFGARYKEPTTGKTANVRVFYGSGKDIYIYPNSITKQDIKKDKDKGRAFTEVNTTGFLTGTVHYSPKSLGMPNIPKEGKNFGEFRVPAERPILVSMKYADSDGRIARSCPHRFFKVQFEENKNYSLTLNTDSRCLYQFLEYTQDGKSIQVKSVEKI